MVDGAHRPLMAPGYRPGRAGLQSAPCRCFAALWTPAPRATQAAKSGAMDPCRALCPLTMHRLNGRGRAGPTPGIILGRGPIVQTSMHATLIVKPNPLRRDRIPLRERVKDLIPPTVGFQQTMPGFDVGIFVGRGVWNAFMGQP
jgi:hypothetical protein